MKRLTVTVLLSAAACAAQAQVQVKDAWVRATVPQQTSSGAFMKLSSPQEARLVEVRTPVAGVAEMHEMKMDGDVMKMRAVAGIDIPAGRGVELKPGGYHVMLTDLKQSLKAGDFVPLTLVVEGKDGKRRTIEVKAEVRSLNASPKAHH